MALLKKETVTGNAIKDIMSATDFIDKYIYNLDSVIAEPLIETEVARHYSLKGENAKRLVKHYKAANKQYIKSKERKGADDSSPEWYEPSDNGLRFLPGVLAGHLAKNTAAFYAAQSHYLYGGGVYRSTDELVMQRIIREKMIERCCYTSQIVDTLNQWNMLIYKPVRDLNCNPYIMNLKNGLFNLLDGSIKEHSSDLYSTVQLGVAYDDNAECPRFMEFLDTVLPQSEHALVQEILGYLMVPVNKAQKCFLFSGAAHAGKSTLLAVAQEILCGSQNCSNIPWQLLSDKFKTAELYGKLANIFADLPQKNLDDSGLFKSITGEDYITVEEKNKKPFSFKPFTRLLFSCNDAPRNYGDRTDGFYRRLIIINFAHPVPTSKRDLDLLEKLRQKSRWDIYVGARGLKTAHRA